MKDGNVHSGHRERMKSKIRRDGLDGFEDHEALEALLFFSIPRRDTNEIAHRLLARFKTLHGVLDASVEELCEVEGVGGNSALLLSMLPGVFRKYLLSREIKSARLSKSSEMGSFFLPYFLGRREESVFLLALNGRMQPISCNLIHSGSVNAAAVSVSKVVSAAVKAKAAYAVIAHNHPGGFAVPSREDIGTTLKIRDALEHVNIKLLDHIIVSDPLRGSDTPGEFVSLSDSGLFTR